MCVAVFCSNLAVLGDLKNWGGTAAMLCKLVVREEQASKHQTRCLVFNSQSCALEVWFFQRQSQVKIQDLLADGCFEFTGTLGEIRPSMFAVKIPCKVSLKPDASLDVAWRTLPLQVRDAGFTEYVHIRAQFHQLSEERTKNNVGGQGVRYKTLCVRSLEGTAYAFVDIKQDHSLYSSLDTYVKDQFLAITEVQSRSYQSTTNDGAKEMKVALMMTAYSRVLSSDGPSSVGDAIYTAWQAAAQSPERRRGLKRLLSEAEDPGADRDHLRQRLAQLEQAGSLPEEDEA